MREGMYLSLDPSSTTTGWAIFYLYGGRYYLESFGLLKPVQSWHAMKRIDRMIVELESIIAQNKPVQVVMELTTGQQGYMVKKMGRSAVNPYLPISQGRIYEACKRAGVTPVTYGEKEWTKSLRKVNRGEYIAETFPAYRSMYARGEDDKLDVADAIGVGMNHFKATQEAEATGVILETVFKGRKGAAR